MNALAERTFQDRIYFCDKPKKIEQLTRKDIPAEVIGAISKLQQLDTRYNWKIPVFFFLWGAAGYVMLLNPGYVLSVLCVILMGLCVNGLPILMHDASHSLLSSNATANGWLGFICGVPGLVSASAFRAIHSWHHAIPRSENDPDDIENAAPKSLPLVVAYYLVLLFGVYLYLFTAGQLGYTKAGHRMKRHIITEYLLMGAIVAVVLVLFPISAVVKVWVLPLLVAGQLANVRVLAEHGLTTSGNAFTNARTVLSNRVVSFYMSNLNYHLEHHLFPKVPWYNLPKVHVLLRETYKRTGASVYRSYSEFLIDFFRITWHGVVPDIRSVPKYVREEICG